jgi:putative membrane protein
MKAHHLVPFAAVLSLSLVAACQKRESEPGGATRTTSANPPSEATGTAAPPENVQKTPSQPSVNEEDKEFILEAAKGGMAEVTLGSMAEQKATSPEVKSFATRMVSDHRKANEELKKLAAEKGVALPTDMGKEHAELSDELSKLSGAPFDREYSKDMVEDHEKDVKAFEKAAKHAKDVDVKAFAERTLPVLQEHLKLAKQMKGAKR